MCLQLQCSFSRDWIGKLDSAESCSCDDLPQENYRLCVCRAAGEISVKEPDKAQEKKNKQEHSIPLLTLQYVEFNNNLKTSKE